MNNKEKIVLTMGAFIILVIIGFVLMHKEEEIILYADDENEISKICVYVIGCVNSPGIFEVEDGTRIHEAIKLAGGETDDADLTRLNLAKILDDEEKVVVPAKVILNENETESESDIVNINTANIEKLTTLSGIGENTAKKIIKYREEKGYFNTIEDLMNVSGIGESKFNSIKDDITT